jgi:microcompartment protein CcmK/EutM
MILARVDGVIVSTVCHPSMAGHRSIICQPLDEHCRDEGLPILAVDPQGAGQHERVLISTDGSRTREIVKDPKSPLRNFVVAIVDAPEKKESA